MGRGEGNRVNEGKNEWCLWRVGCVGEVYEWRTEVTKIEYRQQHDASGKRKMEEIAQINLTPAQQNTFSVRPAQLPTEHVAVVFLRFDVYAYLMQATVYSV